jgi:Trehalose-phosphatase
LENNLAHKRPIEGGFFGVKAAVIILLFVVRFLRSLTFAPCLPQVLVGKKNLEVRPIAVNKGEIVKRLLYKNPDAEFIFCAGDDKVCSFFLFPS